MARYLVERTVKLSKVIEAESKQEAIEEFGDLDADFRVIRETAKLINPDVVPSITDAEQEQVERKQQDYMTKNWGARGSK